MSTDHNSQQVPVDIMPAPHADPFQALRRFCEGEFCCSPAPKTTTRTRAATMDTLDVSLDSHDEASYLSTHEETDFKMNVIITESGTSRAVRVYRGLELFLLATFVFCMTLHLLQKSGIEIMSFSPKEDL